MLDDSLQNRSDKFVMNPFALMNYEAYNFIAQWKNLMNKIFIMTNLAHTNYAALWFHIIVL